ncbi:MAG: Asp-tRNA(Asn)/Glu-tRNA(Gln) amidotransferase subunit GatA [Candidatus Lokiarchaeota archaeon]|nr:Asp-tRNA(Asn)/Glu-tRNA(Gln) amidotransferase subunit GatA [Candidatus Lokiarchaeota archaeon]MBD3200264.1 Asp-tRNA(Asn)/Glu-tRNA(Gln) amidotransferase subunit GatA [Candidatus Lokiarchaeota archaeon]
MKLQNYMAYEIIDEIKREEITIEDVVQSTFENINKTEHKLHSFVNLYRTEALEKAKKLDNKLKNNEPVGDLYGLPLGVKDLICIKNKPVTCASNILEGFKPPYNATVITKLIEKSDGICIGSTNMDEFAMGSSTENSCYGETYNPWNLSCVPGGSSGGSGASVSGGQVLAALGSDTGGSIRCPASYCGVTGLKPTYGRVSRYGLIAYANSLDQIGPLTKCVYDAALLMELMAGFDEKDSTSVNLSVENYTKDLKNSIEGRKIGIPLEFFEKGLDKSVKTKVNDGIKILENLGAESVEMSFPHLEYTIPTYYLIAMSEASSNLARYDGLRYGKGPSDLSGDIFDVFSRTRGEQFGKEVRKRIIMGTYALSAGYYDMFYMKALKARTLIKNDFKKAFERCDVIVSPTMPTTAFKVGELIDDPLKMYLMDILTCPVNLAGLPAISIPCGFDNKDLPIGFQIIGNYFEEKTILNFGFELEQKLDIYKRSPPVIGGK